LCSAKVKVAEKSNEIIAIPKLLAMLAIEGAIVTIDAIGKAGQRFRQAQPDGMARRGASAISARAILNKNADYILALKGNQGSLRQDVELFATEQKASGFADTKLTRDTTVDGDHGRIETRTTTVINDAAWLHERHGWPGLKAVVMVESSRETNGKTEHETRFISHPWSWLRP
jgi:predicted transposase YbfD/YdcC